MLTLADIRKPVDSEIKEFQKHFKKAVTSDVALLNIISAYLLRRKGKQIRPLFVFLTARMLGKITKSTYTAASLIELLHTATLIHDDVVDEAYERRGFFSINALWKSKISVLMGDYFLARGLLLSVNNKDYELLDIVSDAVKEMSEGELLQIQKSRSLNIDMDTYYEVIRKKTATLIASCTASGAKSTDAPRETVDQLYEMGLNVGMAFQIKDDLFDYLPRGVVGKPTGNDIREKKFTLPLIYALNHCPKKERRRILRLFRNGKLHSGRINEIVNFVREKGGLDYAEEKMMEYKQKAENILRQFDDNASRQALQDLIDFTVLRKK